MDVGENFDDSTGDKADLAILVELWSWVFPTSSDIFRYSSGFAKWYLNVLKTVLSGGDSSAVRDELRLA